MMKNTIKTNTAKSIQTQVKAFFVAKARMARKAQKKALVGARKATLKLAKDDSNFTYVADWKPGQSVRKVGCGTAWGKKPTLVGRRHRCVCCNKIVPVEQESSNFCSGKCQRTHNTVLALRARGFGR